MNTYLFQGIVHPERAQVSLATSIGFRHLTSAVEATAEVSVRLNQIAVWIETEATWDIHDLRNVVKSLVQNELDIVGYLKGYAYEVEIRRVLNRGLDVDWVFGIDIPCIAERNQEVDLSAQASMIRRKCVGDEGVFLQRCFSDLSNAMKHADDTGFYCYRAIESLRQHCLTRYGLDPKKREVHWSKLRQLAGCGEDALRELKSAADPVRHGGVTKITSEDRARLFMLTWDVVDGYLKGI